ncbi:MAG: MOSC domain-containing protein [Gemmatimonadota bacterium]
MKPSNHSDAVGQPRVVGLQRGKAADWQFGGRWVLSAIGKTAVQGTVAIRKLGIEGDEQVHLRYHGGPERALCAYPSAHLAEWEREWNIPLPPGSFGENLTVDGLDETTAHIGDRFRFGSALIEITQPREPCANLAGKLGAAGALDRLHDSGRTGWYLRVLEEGEAGANMTLVREQAGASGISVLDAYRIRTDRNASGADLLRLASAPGLSEGWRSSLHRRLIQAD